MALPLGTNVIHSGQLSIDKAKFYLGGLRHHWCFFEYCTQKFRRVYQDGGMNFFQLTDYGISVSTKLETGPENRFSL